MCAGKLTTVEDQIREYLSDILFSGALYGRAGKISTDRSANSTMVAWALWLFVVLPCLLAVPYQLVGYNTFKISTQSGDGKANSSIVAARIAIAAAGDGSNASDSIVGSIDPTTDSSASWVGCPDECRLPASRCGELPQVSHATSLPHHATSLIHGGSSFRPSKGRRTMHGSTHAYSAPSPSRRTRGSGTAGLHC